ncbi:unnamed protein product [Cylindrotheca closterium]|uniref:Uncharacterized protein n=1 Tax=Cylindrotheca closterium TaxID=2856 RepID=A0AAD2FKF7_9STRA|nr:unnamed protein product [Cylindrotheca closterium]
MPPLEQHFADLNIDSSTTSNFLSPDHCTSAISPKRKLHNETLRSKQVTFRDSVKFRLIPSQSEISKKQKQQLWYSPSESASVRREAIRTVRRMSNKISLGPNETSRGLETKTPKEHSAHIEEKRRTIRIVLKEQWRSAPNDRDDEYIAALYRHNSRKAVREAIRLAEIDAAEVYGGSNSAIRGSGTKLMVHHNSYESLRRSVTRGSDLNLASSKNATFQ